MFYRMLKKPCASTPVMTALFCVLLVLPQLFSKPPHGHLVQFGLPDLLTGDQPHYFLMTNSLLEDGDLDLKNNYLEVHRGWASAGRRFAGKPLDHQTYWYINGKFVNWFEVYEYDPGRWGRDGGGFPVPALKDTSAGRVVSDKPEYGIHPPGLALITAGLVWPLRSIALRESAVIFCSALALIVAMVLFRFLLTLWRIEPTIANAVTAVTFLGTPLWHYSRVLCAEPYLCLCGIGAYVFAFGKKQAMLPGIFIAAAILLKPVFAAAALPLLAYFLLNRRWKTLILFCVPCGLSIVALGVMNLHMNGAIGRFGIPFVAGNPVRGALGLLFSPDIGTFSLCPAALAALMAWPVFWKMDRNRALLFSAGFAVYFIVMSFWNGWYSACGYGPRLILPVFPLMMIPLVAFRKLKPGVKSSVVLLCAVSIVINALGAVLSWQFYFRNPLVALAVKLHAML